jgi:hypothetical protein
MSAALIRRPGDLRRKEFIPSLFLIVTLTGCQTVTSVPMAQSSAKITHVYTKNFLLNTEESAAVGQDMLRVKDYYLIESTQDAWEAKQPFEISALVSNLKFHAGIFPIDGRKEVGGKIYDLIHLTPYNGGTLPFLVDSDGHIAKVMNNIEVGADDTKVLPADLRLSKTVKKSVDSTRGYTNFELIYTGASNNTVHISYREYSPEDLARTAFFQDLTYSADQSMINFREIGIQLINATNERILFKVVKYPEAHNDAEYATGAQK